MADEFTSSGSSSFGQVDAPRGRRFAASLVDLVLIPIILGIALGALLLLIPMPEVLRDVILAIISFGWLVVRDLIFSPGRALTKLKLVSAQGGPVTLVQVVFRNVLIGVPYVLATGYFCETARVFIPSILGRRVVYGITFVVGLYFFYLALSTRNVWAIAAASLAEIVPVFVFMMDKAGLYEGNRFMDLYAKTRVVSK